MYTAFELTGETVSAAERRRETEIGGRERDGADESASFRARVRLQSRAMHALGRLSRFLRRSADPNDQRRSSRSLLAAIEDVASVRTHQEAEKRKIQVTARLVSVAVNKKYFGISGLR